MDVTRLLEADHRKVEALFDEIEGAEGDDRMPLIGQLTDALAAHMTLEEELVYPAMEPVTGAESVEEGESEHELARKALAELVALAPDGPGFGAALDAAKAGIDHHVEEEEGEVFPKLRTEGQQILGEMATPFMTRRLELGLPVDAAALAASSTKEELLEEARNGGIEGAASMNKDELAGALSELMGASG
jgi:hemerythrin superfamily protein